MITEKDFRLAVEVFPSGYWSRRKSSLNYSFWSFIDDLRSLHHR